MAAVLSPEATRSDAANALGEEIAVLCSRIYAAQARLLELIARFDEAEYATPLGFPPTAHWLNYQCGVGMNAAREKVRTARALAALPKLQAAFAEGKLSYSKVRALTRIAEPATENYLLMFATYGTAHHVERLVAKTRCVQRLNDPDMARQQFEDRYLHISRDEDGAVILKGRFPAEQGKVIRKALEFWMEQAGGEDPNPPAVTSDKSAETTVSDAEPRNPPAETFDPPTETSQPAAARRADALAGVAETFLGQPDHGGSTADRYQVIVHVVGEAGNPPAVTSDLPTETENPPAVTCCPADGILVSAETSRRIACDANVVVIKEDSSGQPLSVGRRTRSIPPAIRRALQQRDGGCRFPGCTHTRFVDGHHIVHWGEGGETALDNLVLLCRFHHRLVHEGGFRCTRTSSGELRFEDSRQRPLPPGAALPEFNESLENWLDRQFFDLDIDATTPMAKFAAGEGTVDWSLAVDPLVSR